MLKNIVVVAIIALVVVVTFKFFISGGSGSATNVRPVTTTEQQNEQLALRDADSDDGREVSLVEVDDEGDPIDTSSSGASSDAVTAVTTSQNFTNREVFIADSISLPLSGSAPSTDVKFSIPIEDIRQGCFRQDCIPSVDNPEFVSVSDAEEILPDATIGIALSYKGVERFYPFNMLVTREIVNDIVAGDPILVTYCPLCGTGIVFDRTVNGKTFEFGVSGMLWQSNLLMYNRAVGLSERNLWSQVLGEAVVGSDTGTKLTIVPSNVTRFTDWAPATPNGQVLNTGRIGDPYNGNYYGVAQNFAPDFDEANSPLDPTAYVYGIEVGGSFKAYPFDSLPQGVTTDTVGGQTITIEKSPSGLVTITDARGTTIPDVEGFWFSWFAAHPETVLWQN